MLQSMGSQRVGHDLATEKQHNASTLFPTFALLSSSFYYLLIPTSLPYTQGSKLEKSEMLKLRTLCLVLVKSLVGKVS